MEVALDRVGGGVLVDFLFRGVASAETSIASVVSRTGDNTVERLSAGLKEGRGGGNNVCW